MNAFVKLLLSKENAQDYVNTYFLQRLAEEGVADAHIEQLAALLASGKAVASSQKKPAAAPHRKATDKVYDEVLHNIEENFGKWELDDFEIPSEPSDPPSEQETSKREEAEDKQQHEA